MSNDGNSLVTTSKNIFLTSDLYYGYSAFIDELKALEEVYYPLSMHRSLAQSIADQYSGLLMRVKNYANKGKKVSKGEELSNIDKRDIVILNYVHSAILSRLNQLKSSSSSDLVIDILEFIDIIESNIKDIGEQQKIEKIDFYRKEYNVQIQQKIQEANNFIQQLQSAIEKYNTEIDKNFGNLVNEIEKLKDDAKDNIEKLKKNKEKLEKELPYKILFSSLKVLTTGLAFMGPQAGLVGSVIDSGSNIAEAFVLNKKEEKKLPLSSIPPGVKGLIEGYKDFSKKTTERKIEEDKNRIKVITDTLGENPNEIVSQPLKDIVKKRKDIETLLGYYDEQVKNSLLLEPDTYTLAVETVERLQKELPNALKSERAAIEEKIKSGDEKYKKSEKWVARTEKVLNVASAGIEIYNVCKDNDSAMEEIDNVIRKNQESIEKLKKFADKINTFSQETIKKMKGDIENLQNSLRNQSHIALDVSKWEIQTSLKDIKHELDKMTSGFQSQSDFIHVFEKMSDAIATLVGIYDRIQNYQEQAQMVDYIANVSSAVVTNDYPEVNQLKIIVLQNTILERYSILVSAIRQWAFPFADKFFRDFNFMLGIDSKHDIKKNMENVTNIIQSLKEKVKTYNATITKMDEKIVTTSFGLNDAPNPPFFTWKGSQYTDIIKTLLKEGSKAHQSDEITLISSVQGFNYSAVKFNKIELKIRHKDLKKQQELDSCLDNFNVYLTYSTNSYYKFDNKIYIFGSNSQGNNVKSNDINSHNKLQFMYGFKKDKDGSLITKNQAYKKFEKGELMLSPYSMWQVKLALTNEKGKNFFKDLEKYSGFVYLELVGNGSYVDEENMTDEEKDSLILDKYYQAEAPIQILSNLQY